MTLFCSSLDFGAPLTKGQNEIFAPGPEISLGAPGPTNNLENTGRACTTRVHHAHCIVPNVVIMSQNTHDVVGTVYRHPENNKKQFTEGLSNILTSLNLQHKTYFVLGDININVSLDQQTTAEVNYINEVTSCGAYNIISFSTRETFTSSTIIDHIITNDASHSLIPV